MIYFAQPRNGGPVRIGASNDVDARKRTLGTWLPGGIETILEIEGGFLGEAILHYCFNPIRIERDWFRSCDALWQFILDTKKERPNWLPKYAGKAIKLDPQEIADEFGSFANAAKILGYSSEPSFRQSMGWQTPAGFGLSSRIFFFRLMRDGSLPPYIVELHKARSRQIEVAA